MSSAKENPPSVRDWYGHLWNCKQCCKALPRDFDVRGLSMPQLADYCQQTAFDGLCEHGAELKADAEAVISALNALGSSSRKEAPPETPWKTIPFDPRKYILPETLGQKEFLVSMLTGSQAKTAFALRMNAEKMCREGGIEAIGFLTLTVGDYHCKWHGKQRPREHNSCPKCQREMKFIQVFDSKEASRRINNLNRRVIHVLFEKAICVTERMKSEAIHFHLLGILSGRPDIRTGLDFDAVKDRDYQTASPQLRKLWARLRAMLPGYGFGRAELLPVKKTGEAVSSYISKYIEKNVANRLKEDAHKKLVRYVGWNKEQLKPNEFEWNGEKSRAWRAKTREILGTVYCQVPDKPITSIEARIWISAGNRKTESGENCWTARKLTKLSGQSGLFMSTGSGRVLTPRKLLNF